MFAISDWFIGCLLLLLWCFFSIIQRKNALLCETLFLDLWIFIWWVAYSLQMDANSSVFFLLNICQISFLKCDISHLWMPTFHELYLMSIRPSNGNNMLKEFIILFNFFFIVCVYCVDITPRWMLIVAAIIQIRTVLHSFGNSASDRYQAKSS